MSLFGIGQNVGGRDASQSGRGVGAPSNSIGLSSILGPDGSVRGGAIGNFDPDGYQMTLGPNGEPRFFPDNVTASTTASCSDGWQDGFSEPGIPGGSEIYAVATDQDGNLYVGGNFSTIGGLTVNGIAKWDGSEWSALGSGVDGIVFAIATSGTNVYVGGTFNNAGGLPANKIAKWDGTNWTSMGTVFTDSNGNGQTYIIRTIAASDSAVYAGGSNSSDGGNVMALWLGGTSWNVLGTGHERMFGTINSIVFQNTDIIVGGEFTADNQGNQDIHNIARWTGNTWISISQGTIGPVRSVAVHGFEIFVSGDFTTARNGNGEIVSVHHIARWSFESGWSAIGDNFVGGGQMTVIGDELFTFGQLNGGPISFVKLGTDGWTVLAGAAGYINSLASYGSTVYMGGLFSGVDGGVFNNLARWNGSRWTGVGGGMQSDVNAIISDGRLTYAGGTFTRAGGVPANKVAVWNGSDWAPLGSGMNGGADEGVLALAKTGSYLYAGGSFTTADGNSANRVAKWNGDAWSAMGQGRNDTVTAMAVTANGRVYAGGSFTTADGVTVNRIAYWNGVRWFPLGSGVNGVVNSLAIVGNDVYVGGGFTLAGGISANGIAKWNGASWSALGTGIADNFNPNVQSIAVSDGGTVYVGGSFTAAGGVPASNVAKWDGSTWSALGSGVNGQVRSLALSRDNTTVYAAGYFQSAGGNPANHIAKWNGSSWSAIGTGASDVSVLSASSNGIFAGGSSTSFGCHESKFFAQYIDPSVSPDPVPPPGPVPTPVSTPNVCAAWDNKFPFDVANASITAMAKDGAGNFYFGFSYPTNVIANINANRIVKWDGTSWSSLGSGLNGEVATIVLSGTDVYVGGRFSSAGGVPANNIAKWNGTSWSALGAGTSDSVLAIAVSGTDVYAGGWFWNAGGIYVRGIAKWNGSNWSPLGSGVTFTQWDGNLYTGTVYSIALSGTDVYVGGTFQYAGGVAAHGIAKWNGSSWSALGSGLADFAEIKIAVSGSNVYAAGNFSIIAGANIAHNVAKWNGSSWSAVGTVTNGYSGPNGDVNDIKVSGNDVYIAGQFGNVNGLTAKGLAKWNGTSWSAIGSGLDNVGYWGVSGITLSGSEIYAFGDDLTLNGVPKRRLAKWNGSAWSPFVSMPTAGPNDIVTAIATSGSNAYVGGRFTTAGGVSAKHIAKWNGTSWSALGSGIDGYDIHDIATQGSDVYVAGEFTSAGGVPARGIAKWNGSSWSALGTGLNSDASAVVVSGNSVYVGGWFTTAGGVQVNGIAKWDGANWSALGSGVNGGIYTISVSGNDVYVGGQFTTAGGIPANGIAKWNGSEWSSQGFPANYIGYRIAVSGNNVYAIGSDRDIARWNGTTWASIGRSKVMPIRSPSSERMSSLGGPSPQ